MHECMYVRVGRWLDFRALFNTVPMPRMKCMSVMRMAAPELEFSAISLLKCMAEIFCMKHLIGCYRAVTPSRPECSTWISAVFPW